MAEHFFYLSIFIFTFLMVNGIPTSSQEVKLVKEPDDNYYIAKKIPVVIVCQAKNAAEITFTCMGSQIPSTSVEVKDVSDIDPDLIEAEIEVTRADVQNSESRGHFWCQCNAVDNEGNVVVTSKKSNVSIASLKNKFETEPASTTVTVGQDVEFACRAPEGRPKPEIIWRKEKKRLEVENNPRIYITSNDSLVIHLVTLEDMGQYQCVATNIAGRRESTKATLTVTALAESAEAGLEVLEEEVHSKKSSGLGKLRATRQSIKTYFITEPLEVYYITREKPVTVDCGVVAADILTYNCNGKRMGRERQTINQGIQAGYRLLQGQLTLTYDDVLKEFKDETFQCICVAWYHENGDKPKGWSKVESNIENGFIRLAYLDPTFKTEPSDVTAGLNSDVVLLCEPPEGQPTPWVHWYKDGNRLDPRTTEKYSLNIKGHLTVHHVQYEDAGSYNCLAENSVSSAQSKSGRLTVSAESVVTTTTASQDNFPTFPATLPSLPVFLIDFEPEYTLDANGTKTMVCAVVSAQQMTIDCGEQRLTSEEYVIRTEKHKDSDKRLLQITAVINSTQVQQNPNNYFCQCTAWFMKGRDSWERLTSSRGFIRPHIVYIRDNFKTPPVDTSADYDSEVEIACEPPAGSPTPKVYWLKDGVPINSDLDPNFITVSTGSLVIELVRVEDEGEYICVAENEAGVRSSQPIKFTVLGKPDTQSETTAEPKSEPETVTPGLDIGLETESLDPQDFFVHQPAPNYYILDYPVTLSCTALDITTLIFVCNGESLLETKSTGSKVTHPITNKTIRENSLTLTKNMIEQYSGSEPYTCFCRIHYMKKDNTQVNIDSSPAVIKISYLSDDFRAEPSDKNVAQFERVELECGAPDGVPEPKISWVKDGSYIVENEKIRVQEGGNLIIERFDLSDQGTYICLANNSFEEIESRPAQVSLTEISQPEPSPEIETHEPEPETTTSDSEKLFSGNPYISKDLHSVYYIVKNRPATITCEAYGVSSISFTCNMRTVGEQETQERTEELILPDGTVNSIIVVEASINVTKAVVEDEAEYWCKCYAHYRNSDTNDDQKLESVKGIVQLAYIKKNFQREPMDKTVQEGDSLSLECQPPLGNPPPTITWTKNGESIKETNILSSPSALLINDIELENEGEYICVAENDAGKRMSSPATIKIKGDSLPVKTDTDENVTVNGETEESSQTNVDESEVDYDTDRKAEIVTVSSFTRETDQSIDNGISEDNIVEGNKEDVDNEITDETFGEGGQHEHENEIEDHIEENIHETVEENNEDILGERSEERQNGSEEYGGSDRNNDRYKGHGGNKRVDFRGDRDEEQDATKSINEDRDYSYSERDETIDTKEDGNVNGIGSRKSTGGNECIKLLTSCSKILPTNQNQIVFCQNVPDYIACLDNYFAKCEGIVSEASTKAVKTAYADTQKICTLKQNCPQLKECAMISSNSLDNSVGKSDITVHDLCMSDASSILQCVNNKLKECNVTVTPPEKDSTSLNDIDSWFTQYCNRFIMNNEELRSCDAINRCELKIDELAVDNATYWCRILNTLNDCAINADDQCGLVDANSLSNFHFTFFNDYCSGGSQYEATPEPGRETDAVGAVEPEPEGGTTTEKPTDNGNEDDDDDNGEDGNEEDSIAEGKHKAGEIGGAEDFENNAGGEDYEDAGRENGVVAGVVTSKAQGSYNTNSDKYDEEDSSNEDYYSEIDKNNPPRNREGDQHAGRNRPDVHNENSEEEDKYVSSENFPKTLPEEDDSIDQVEDEDQRDVETSMNKASQENLGSGGAVSGTSILLATSLQVLTVVCLSWR